MGSEAKTYEGIKVLILASYPAISGISQNRIQGIEKNIGSINNVKIHSKWKLIFIFYLSIASFTIINRIMTIWTENCTKVVFSYGSIRMFWMQWIFF